MKFSVLQDQLKEKFGIEHLADMARELGVSPQAVSNWKARDKVPYKYVLKIRERLEKSDTTDGDSNENLPAGTDQVFQQYGYPQYFEEDTISLIDIILTLVKNLRIILITPTIFCILTIINVQFIAQPFYESTAKIMSSSGSGFSQASGLASRFGITFPIDNSEPQWIYPEIIKSRTLARAMLDHKFDTEKYGQQKTLLQILTYGDKEPTVGLDTLIKAGVNGVIGMISIKPVGSYYLLTITAAEPLFARDFAVALIEELDDHQREYNQAKTSETRQFIEERIVNTEKELRAAEEDLKNFRDHNRRIQNSPALLLEQQRFSREVAVLTGVFTTLKQQLETTKIEEVKESDYVVVLDPPEAPQHPSGPRKKLMVVFAGCLGIGLGIVIGFAREYAENSKGEKKEKMNLAKSLFIESINLFRPGIFKLFFKK